MLFGCLFGILGAFAPRIALLMLSLARPVYFNAVFGSGFLACLGFLFLPFTTLMYALLASPVGTSLSLVDWLFIIIAFLLDIGAIGGTAWANKNNIPGRTATTTGTPM
jgi:hypothetical protein